MGFWSYLFPGDEGELADLFWSNQQTSTDITLKNQAYTGTSGEDTVSFAQLSLAYNPYQSEVYLLEGSDSTRTIGTSSGTRFYLGDGDDFFTALDGLRYSRVEGGKGDDTIRIKESLWDREGLYHSIITTDEGSDYILIEKEDRLADSRSGILGGGIFSGGGDDALIIRGNGLLIQSSGSSLTYADGSTTRDGIIRLGEGKDFLGIYKWSAPPPTGSQSAGNSPYLMNSDVDLGGGEDTVDLRYLDFFSSTGVILKGGEGYDVAILPIGISSPPSWLQEFESFVYSPNNGNGTTSSITSSTPGDFQEGVTLTAPAITADPDGDAVDPNYAYQWYKDGIAIADATASTYSVPQAGAGTYKVGITYRDAQGFTETLDSPEQVVSASFNEGGITADLIDGTLELLPPTFQVMDVRQTASGLALKLSEAPDLEKLNLYDGQDASVDLPDLRLTRNDGTAVEDLSLHWKAETSELYVIHTDSLTGINQSQFATGASPFQSDLLAAGDYTLVIDARSDGLVSASSGELVDGNGDGITGDAFSYSFTKSTPSNLISIGDTARGSGQSLGLNGIAQSNGINGLPVLVSTTASIRSLRGTVTYDATAFNNASLVVGRDLPEDWTLETQEDVIGSLNYTASGTTAIIGTDQELFRFDAVVSQDAPYGASTLIEATVEAPEDPTLAFESDPSLVVLAYSGDTTGNGGHSSLDASRIQRVVVGLDSGFDPYDMLAPTLIGDTTGNGGLSSLDASRVQQEVVGLTVTSFPSIPSDPLV